MNDIFELKRFGLLLKKAILERPIQLMGLTGLILAATLIIYAWALDAEGWNFAQYLAFELGFVVGGCFLSSVVFGYFGTNASGAAYLTMPASTFEKWLCGALIAGLFFTCVFLVFYRLMDAGFVAAYHNRLDKNNPQYKELYDRVQILTFDNLVVKQSAMLYANFAGAMMVGALYFNKVSAIKTALVYCGIWAVIYFLNLIVAKAFFTNVDAALPFNSIFIKVGNDDGSLELPRAFSNMATLAIQFIIPGIVLITAFIRLREKEI
ncbi:MAG TPA: hypothetical protein VIM16_20685 [Mucilaginibacter sp.]|jgi:hypothetical protein